MKEQDETYWGPRFWEELRRQQPERVCETAVVEYDPAGFYELISLGKIVRVYPGEERLETDDPVLASSADYQLLIVSYLINSQNIESAGKWVSEKELRGGSTFFRGPHALPAATLEKRFGDDPEGFRERSIIIGGQPLEFGDVSMAFRILPRISVAVVLWTRDDEFPARVTFMLDSSVDAHLDLYVIYAMTKSVVQKLIAE